MAAREKAPDGAEPLIIQEGGEPTSKDDKPADKPGSGPAKERPRRPTANGPRAIGQYCRILPHASYCIPAARCPCTG